MALNDTFTIQEINLDKKNLSYDNKPKEIEAYWNNECAEHPSCLLYTSPSPRD